jgi:2-polyprenyl-3-methyl-5-hydroxy-6-metoxy-1,4-benzoquinol methylase
LEKNKDVKNWISYWGSHKGTFAQMPDIEMAEKWNSQWGRTETGISKKLAPGKKKKRMKDIFELLDEAGFKVKGSRILDIGCGPGATSIPFAEAGAKVTALDISSIALDRIQKYADKKSLI